MRGSVAFALTVGALGLAGALFVFRDRGIPSAQTIREIEATVVMPEGAAPLDFYDRFYAYQWKGWRQVIVGVFAYRHPGVPQHLIGEPVPMLPGAYAVREAPVIFDGGCSVVTIYYDETSKQLLLTDRDGKQQAAACNGV